MKTFAAMIDAVPDYVERRQPYREAHLDRLRKMKEEGHVLLGGAWADPADGALIIYRAETLAEVREMVEEDPYYKNGLWSAVRIREWTIVVQ